MDATATERTNDILTSDQMADYLCLDRGTPPVWRSRGIPDIPYYKVGRAVRYKRSDLDAFLAANRVGGDAA
jgi:excisionase family DNA binding protein